MARATGVCGLDLTRYAIEIKLGGSELAPEAAASLVPVESLLVWRAYSSRPWCPDLVPALYQHSWRGHGEICDAPVSDLTMQGTNSAACVGTGACVHPQYDLVVLH